MGRIRYTEFLTLPTGRAAEMIANREYRFLSPVLHYHPTTGQVLRLIGAGLVHRPNLALTALSEQEMTMPDPLEEPAPTDLSRIAAALGLDEAADANSILTAINAQTAPDPARYVPIEAVADLLKQRNGAAGDNAARAAEAKVQQAMDAEYLTPAMRDWAIALCTQNEASFDSFVTTATPAYAHLLRPSRLHDASPDVRGRKPASADERAICEQLGLSPDDLK
ncbi:phage protease [Paracoccus marinaquae]|uniref:Phage protease n=1 Tax=Paracoccus marinaquae TaxID=2841926 RepID=A0ABS6AM21_9RHOB|nr:phage protease [Paracoccus marinaquae]MBU3031640.1 phage protease [Paracoccus marinaquae]